MAFVVSTITIVTGSLVALWALFWAGRSRGRARCPKCWYDMREHDSWRCPECGHEVTDVRHLYRTQRRGRVALLAIVFAASAPLLWWASSVRRNGWIASLPDPVVMMLMPWAPDVPTFVVMVREVDVNASNPWETGETWLDRLFLARMSATMKRGVDADVRATAVEWAEFLEMRAAVDALPNALVDRSERVQKAALSTLSTLSQRYDVRSSGPALNALLDHPNPLIRIRACEAACQIGLGGAEDRVTALIRFCDDDRRTVRIEAMKAIASESSEAATRAIPVLSTRAFDLTLTYPNEHIESFSVIEERYHAYRALRRVESTPEAPEASPYMMNTSLAGALVNVERGIRVSGLETILRKHVEGSPVSDLLPLIKTLARHDVSSEVRVTALRVAVRVNGGRDPHLDGSARQIIARPNSYRTEHLMLLMPMFPDMLPEILPAVDESVYSGEFEPDVALLVDDIDGLEPEAAVDFVIESLWLHQNQRVRGGAALARDLQRELASDRP